MDRRVALALGVVAAAALLGAALWWLVDEDLERPRSPNDEPAPAAPAPVPEEPRAAAKPAARRADEAAPAPVPPPVPTGSLEVLVRGKEAAKVRAHLFLPAGETVAIEDGATSRAIGFPRVPADTPLVLRLSAPGYLTGLCCDVFVPADRTLRKEVTLLAAPRIDVRLRDLGALGGGALRAELVRGDAVVAVADASSRMQFEPSAVGSLRLRLVRGGEPPLWETPIDVSPGDGQVEFEFTIPKPRFVTFSIVDASGRPAAGAVVSSVSHAVRETSAVADREGIAQLARPRGAEDLFTAVARGAGGAFATAVVNSSDGVRAIPLVLGDAVTLTGDVVDPGNRAVANARVAIEVRPLVEPVVVRSAESGLFESPPLPGGLASVTVTCDGYEPWRSETPVEIQPRVGGRIRARLVPLPVGAVVVTVRDDAGAAVGDADVVLHPSRLRARTRADGTCRVDGVAADTEQAVYARLRGYRGAADGSPRVHVHRDTAVPASVTLRRSPAPQAEAADQPVSEVSVAGRFLDAESRPVGAVRVESSGVAAFSGADGRFALAGVRLPDDASPAEVVVTPGAGLFDPVRIHVHAEDAPRKDFGDVRLHRRPYALVEFPAAPPRLASRSAKGAKAGPVDRAGVFWLSTNQADVLLGVRTAPFEPLLCVSYDGTWLHLPPADAWRTNGRGEVFLAHDTGRGLATAATSWTLRPDADARLEPAFPAPSGRLSGGVLAALKGGRDAALQQAECATLFDPRAEHVPTGNPRPPVDPFAALTAWRTFRVSRKDLDWDVAPGRWKLVGDSASAECLVPPWLDPLRR